MGVLEDAIREHLDLKRKHGASDEELTQQEAEALGPARRDLPDEEGAAPAQTEGEKAASEAGTVVAEPAAVESDLVTQAPVEPEAVEPAPPVVEQEEEPPAAPEASEPAPAPEPPAQETVVQAPEDVPGRPEAELDPDFGEQPAERERPGSQHKQPPDPDFD